MCVKMFVGARSGRCGLHAEGVGASLHALCIVVAEVDAHLLHTLCIVVAEVDAHLLHALCIVVAEVDAQLLHTLCIVVTEVDAHLLHAHGGKPVCARSDKCGLEVEGVGSSLHAVNVVACYNQEHNVHVGLGARAVFIDCTLDRWAIATNRSTTYMWA